MSASASLFSVAISWPNSVISPRVGRSARNSRRSSEVLPAPEGPVRNWNECGSIRKVRSRRTSGPTPYRNPTFSNRTTCPPPPKPGPPDLRIVETRPRASPGRERVRPLPARVGVPPPPRFGPYIAVCDCRKSAFPPKVVELPAFSSAHPGPGLPLDVASLARARTVERPQGILPAGNRRKGPETGLRDRAWDRPWDGLGPAGSGMVSDSLTDARYRSDPSLILPRFADADRLSELHDILPGRDVRAGPGGAPGALRALPLRLVRPRRLGAVLHRASPSQRRRSAGGADRRGRP